MQNAECRIEKKESKIQDAKFGGLKAEN